MMPRTSMHAGLSVRYTNHCVRATSVVLLKKAGFEDHEVCFITGHTIPKSLSSYSQPTEEVKAKMAFAMDTKPVSESSTSLVVSSTENTSEQETSDSVALPKIQLPRCRCTCWNCLQCSEQQPAERHHSSGSSVQEEQIKSQEEAPGLTLLLLKRIKYCVVLFYS